MKKWMIVALCIVTALGVIGVIVVNQIINKVDQVYMQYDNEVISEYKRTLDFSPYNLETFDRYDALDELVMNADAKTIQSYILNGEFTTVELCQYYLTRIKNFESYNAVIQLNPNILEEAALIDQKLQAGNSNELFGICFLLKDNIAAVNMNTTAGAYVLRNLTTTRDAFIVDMIKENDGLVLGKANLSEWSNYMSFLGANGFSVLGGQTKNAYGKFDVGGSSSGPSVAAALNLATVTIGTETCGSLIHPAGQNSVIALKPTLGLLSRDLIIPISEAQDTAGVIARNVNDLNMVFNQLVKYDQEDKQTEIANAYNPVVDLDADYLKGKRIGVIDRSSKEMTAIVEQFEALDAVVVDVELSEAALGADMVSVLNYGIVHDVHDFLNNEAVITNVLTLENIVNFNRQNEDFMPYGQNMFEIALAETLSKDEADSIIGNNKTLTKTALDNVIDNNNLDAVLSISNDLSAVYAPSGYPALTIPAGYSNSGEPFGLTLVGKALDDQKLINMGYAYEQHYSIRQEP